jgi:hypothetical protein
VLRLNRSVVDSHVINQAGPASTRFKVTSGTEVQTSTCRLQVGGCVAGNLNTVPVFNFGLLCEDEKVKI